MLKNTRQKYGFVAKFFHWVIALMIISLLAVGLYMTGLKFSPEKFELYDLHKATGIVVLFLAVLRVFWRFKNIQPDPVIMPKLQELGAKVGHVLLYVAMFVMPLSGWAMSSSAGYPVSVFGLWTMPPLVGKDKAFSELMSEIHEFSGYALIALIVVHAAAALHHHFIVKDETLKRML